MIIGQNTHAITTNISTKLTASEGSPPYTYEVLPGGVGGTVSAEGLYTAPNKFGVDTIRATDSLGVIVTATVTVVPTLKLLCDIIASELELDSDQVFIWNQKFPVLKDQRMYVVVGVVSSRPFTNSAKFNSDGTVTQSATFRTMLSLDIMSKSTLAVDRKEEVVMALASVYAEQQQELNAFSIGKLPTNLVPLSEGEGAAIPYRFNFSVSLQYSVRKTKAVPYFDNFSDADLTTKE